MARKNADEVLRVFLGLIAGREVGIALRLNVRSKGKVSILFSVTRVRPSLALR